MSEKMLRGVHPGAVASLLSDPDTFEKPAPVIPNARTAKRHHSVQNRDKFCNIGGASHDESLLNVHWTRLVCFDDLDEVVFASKDLFVLFDIKSNVVGERRHHAGGTG
jgi:hypothetical protein